MFTGIIEELGEVQKIQQAGRNTSIEIKVNTIFQDTQIDDSIAVNGVCLTVVKNDSGRLSFEVMTHTLRNTNLGSLRIKSKVNLERSLKLGDRVSGHFVYGHIDCLGVIRRKTVLKDNLCFEIAVPVVFIPQLILRGSVAIDGISLTIQNKRSNGFSVYIIPHTLKNTTLYFKSPSDKVNIEIDKLGVKGI